MERELDRQVVRDLGRGECTDAHESGLRERDLTDPASEDHDRQQRQHGDRRAGGHIRPVRREQPREREEESDQEPAQRSAVAQHQISSSWSCTDLPVMNMKTMTTPKMASSRAPGKSWFLTKGRPGTSL